ncbi:unnamed protein product [Linum trigynum]|uniref:Uncharacterized protein n=1 Tax=Linum trigynum TaxID=586398 RepID=A0AAV2CIM0_9ROSI
MGQRARRRRTAAPTPTRLSSPTAAPLRLLLSPLAAAATINSSCKCWRNRAGGSISRTTRRTISSPTFSTTTLSASTISCRQASLPRTFRSLRRLRQYRGWRRNSRGSWEKNRKTGEGKGKGERQRQRKRRRRGRRGRRVGGGGSRVGNGKYVRTPWIYRGKLWRRAAMEERDFRDFCCCMVLGVSC